jgi:hypothetical protein
MDFSSRSVQTQQAPVAASHPAGGGKRSSSDDEAPRWARFTNVVLGAAVIVLLVAVVAYIGFSNSTPSESKYVDSSRLQAVFLNTGQVYFGNIKTLNDKYFVVTNIYYLQTSSNGSSSSDSSNTSVTLVKLGCELHEPYDQMVINRDQVTFWENLQAGGQVAKAVSTFQKDNPNGQKCTDQSSSSSNNSANSVQNAATPTPAP